MQLQSAPIRNTYQKTVLVTGWDFDSTQQKSLKYNMYMH